MNLLDTVAAMEAARAAMTGAVALVPTMGALHDGHLSLVRRARAESDTVVVSVFVNPTQFGPGEDLDRYPRDLDRDLRLLEAEDVDAVFVPTAGEMYPPGFDQWVEVAGPLAARLEGEFRPHFFRGVTTVVARLLRTVRPDRAYFGEKDAQQLRVVRRMVEEQALPVEIVACPTVREADGLAMSSRNAYLSPEERTAALAIPEALRAAVRMVEGGERAAAAVRGAIERRLAAEPLARVDYVSVAGSDTLEELRVIDRPALALVAARVGSTRLIDNVRLDPARPEPVEG